MVIKEPEKEEFLVIGKDFEHLEHKPRSSEAAKARVRKALATESLETLLGKGETSDSNNPRLPNPDIDKEEHLLFSGEDIPVFDETNLGSDSLYQEILNPGLTPAEVERAKSLYNMARGVMIVTGFPGAGKGLFANTLSWKLVRTFKGKVCFRDDVPKRPFGYHKLFNEEFIMQEMESMARASGTTVEMQKELKSKKQAKDVATLSKQWLETRGKVMLQNGVLLLDEFWRYMHNRRPMNPMGITIGGIIKTWRHLDLLIIGMAPQKRELDAISCLPYITHEVRCSWSLTQSDTTDARVFKVRYVGAKGVIEAMGQPMLIRVNGQKPHPEICSTCWNTTYTKDFSSCASCQKRYFDLFSSKNIQNLKPQKMKEIKEL